MRIKFLILFFFLISCGQSKVISFSEAQTASSLVLPNDLVGKIYPLCGLSGSVDTYSAPGQLKEKNKIVFCPASEGGLGWQNIYFFNILARQKGFLQLAKVDVTQPDKVVDGPVEVFWIKEADFFTPFVLTDGTTMMPLEILFPTIENTGGDQLFLKGYFDFCNLRPTEKNVVLIDSLKGKKLEVKSFIIFDAKASCRT